MTNVQQDGRVALITGASRGIGAVVARLLASRGMRVVVNYHSNRDMADDVVASIKSAGGQAMAVPADVRDGSAVLGMVEQVRATMGEVEVLVHNALVPYAIKSFDEVSWDELGGKLEQEMRAAFLMTKAVVPGMTTRGYGRIVYLGAVLSRRPHEGMIALGTSKAALSSFAHFVAQELGPRGITVNVVAPGPVERCCRVIDGTLRTVLRQHRPAAVLAARPRRLRVGRGTEGLQDRHAPAADHARVVHPHRAPQARARSRQ